MIKKIALIIIIIAFSCTISYASRYANPDFVSLWKAPENLVYIQSMQEKSWTFPDIPRRSGKIAVIRLNAIIRVDGNGSNNHLAMSWNGKSITPNVGNVSVGPPRLLNYSYTNYMTNSNDASVNKYFKDNGLCVPFSGMSIASNDDSAELGWYVLDISDLTFNSIEGTFSQNIFSITNRAKPEYWGPNYFGPEYAEGKAQVPLIIRELEVGYLPITDVENAPLRKAYIKYNTNPKTQFTLSNKNYNISVSTNGGLLVKNGKETYAVNSFFSYPYVKDAWNTLNTGDISIPGWKVSISKSPKSAIITGECKFYKISRKIVLKSNHIQIFDTYTNTTDESVGIVFDNKITPANSPKEINVGGKYIKTYIPYDSGNPPWNPTIYFAGDFKGLGMVALDDYYKLQLNLSQEGKTGIFHNENFGIPAKGSYTFEWALYPTKTSDYYGFINAARKDYVPNYAIEGEAGFMPYTLPLQWSTQKMSDYLKHRSLKIVILTGPYSGGPWLGEDSNYIYNVPNFNLEEYLQTLKKARSILKKIDPEIKCLAPFETALSPDLAPGDLKPTFPDSVVIAPNGNLGAYRWPSDPEARKKFTDTLGHQYVYSLELNNSYYKWTKERIIRALKDAQMDGIYFDLFSYASGDPPDLRWTYGKWDNRSVDMDLTNYTISRTKADLCKLTEDARADICKTILNYKKGNVIVANDMGVTSKIKKLPIFHFSETVEDYGYSKTHFSTPIIFGMYGGYVAGAEFVKKEGTWWKTWANDSDYFQDIKDKLKNGCLMYTYMAPGGYYESLLTRPTMLDKMFPITIEEIHAGWIKGKERIVTLKPGLYSWNDKSKIKAYFYDADGKECSGTIKTLMNTDGTYAYYVDFPEGGAAAIVKN